MAVATSETSARVGMGDSIIDSSICVATITGLAAARHLRTSRFWMGGTFCTGSSTPRSPRATMIPSETARMSSKHFTAAGFSIFDRMAARPRASVRASFTSSARCTKLSASQSTPSPQTNSRSARSLSDSAATGSTTSGTLTPLRLEMVPPTTTSHSAKSAPHSFTRRRILPSLTSRSAPGSSAAKISGWGRQTRGIALRPVEIEPERRALDQLFLATGERADAQLGPLQIGEDGDGAVHFRLDLADDAVALGDLVVLAVAHVEAEHVCARLMQRTDGGIVRRGGAERGHDLDIAVPSHLLSSCWSWNCYR